MSDDAATQIEAIIQYINTPGVRYNCKCQVGGVDAVSVDTDWLLYALRSAKLAAIREVPYE